jgi:hypothetical protein
MERFLSPQRLEIKLHEQGDETAETFSHWKQTLDNFFAILDDKADTEEKKYMVLCNYVSPSIFTTIKNVTKYEDAIEILTGLFVKTKNTNFARYCLSKRSQNDCESIDQFVLALRTLAKQCNFTEVTATVHGEESIRTAFISGLKSNQIRQRLMEDTKTLTETVTLALTLEQSISNSEKYGSNLNGIVTEPAPKQDSNDSVVAAIHSGSMSPRKCGFCGYEYHARSACPAKDTTCKTCDKRGHWARVCRSANNFGKPSYNKASKKTSTNNVYTPVNNVYNTPTNDSSQSNASSFSYLCAMSPSTPTTLAPTTVRAKVNNQIAFILIDTGSSESFVDSGFARRYGITVGPGTNKITLASESMSTNTQGSCVVDIVIEGHSFLGCKLSVMDRLCCDVIVGLDLLRQHENLVVNFGGSRGSLIVDEVNKKCAQLCMSNLKPIPLFSNLMDDVKPVACRSRKYSDPEREFISRSVKTLLEQGTIRPSSSPWRAQVLVTGLDSPRPRMVVDYSRTINKYTQLDAYPLPNLDMMATQVAKYKIFSTFDLKSAYHQIPILEVEKPLTAFEADGKLFEFNGIPFGVTNGGPVFQRNMDSIVEENKLEGVFPYLDNITVGGYDQNDHDKNVVGLMSVIEKLGLTLNHEKTISSVDTINILGYQISHGTIRPDPERMQPLRDLPVPHDPESLKRAMGLFSYYAKWVPKFSDTIRPLIDPEFPLQDAAITAYNNLKASIEQSCVVCPNGSEILVLESDASDFAISASLNQGGKPVAFFSRTLKSHEQKHHAVEKEACAIVEACRAWRHYLVGRHFKLLTDQEAVSYIYDKKNHGKTKNSKIDRWRIELSCLDFDIEYRPGPLNVTADCLSRAFSAATYHTGPSLVQIHDELCHPGTTRMYHFVRSKNLTFSLAEVKDVIAKCGVCSKVKPRFCKPSNSPLIKATQPFERLSIDFKGPLPSSTGNKYLLTVVDEFSRFPFAIPCRDQEAGTVIKALTNLFSLFGTPGSIHSDNGPSLISQEFRSFLIENNIGYSNSSRYNPQGNGQCERYNAIIWKGIELALCSRNMVTSGWELVLPQVLHSIRTLLCTSTNQTPHERLFSYRRRSATGHSLPTWLVGASKVLLRKHTRLSKYDDLCEEVEIVSLQPESAQVRFASGREASVSLRDIAPLKVSEPNSYVDSRSVLGTDKEPTAGPAVIGQESDPVPTKDVCDTTSSVNEEVVPNSSPLVRRSERSNKGVPPARFEAG